MSNPFANGFRLWGAAPFRVVVVHGGPGAVGSLAPLARELAAERGIVETAHTARSIAGQLNELRAAIASAAEPPVTIIGHSWGAMLAYLFAARFPELVEKVILVGSGPYEAHYAEGIDAARASRLTPAERDELRALEAAVEDPAQSDRADVFARIGDLTGRADAYDPLPHDADASGFEYETYASVWPEAAKLRRSGELLRAGASIQCPVVAIHGEYDPHPVAGIQEPLAATLADFRLFVLERCGHEPWIERQARDAFFRILCEELRVERG